MRLISFVTTTSSSLKGGHRPWNRVRWGSLVKSVLSLCILALVMAFVDFRQLFNIVLSVDPWYLVAAAVVFYLDRALMAYKWDLLLRALNARVPLYVLFRTYLVTNMFLILPTPTISVDLFRLYNLSRFDVSNRAVLASMIMERAIGFVATLSVALLGLGLAFYLLQDRWTHLVELGWATLAIAMIGLILAVITYILLRSPIRILMGLRKYPILGKLQNLLGELSKYRSFPHTITAVAVSTILEQFVPLIAAYLIVQALHIDVSLVELIVVIPIATLAMRIPVSLGGFGVQEGLYVALFGIIGVSVTEAVLLSTTSKLLVVITSLPWGIHYLLMADRPAILPSRQSATKTLVD